MGANQSDRKVENIHPSRAQQERLKVPGHVPSGQVNQLQPSISQQPRSTADTKRVSQVSATSNTSGSSSVFRKPKTHVGPWQLGKTLGKGSSARVRLARHEATHEHVAVKIVAKSVCSITQAGSLAKLHEIDSAGPEYVEGVRRMPLAIEREVAILKLIEHPNIVKLYDIWENRNEIYLIMEFVEKGDLFEYILHNGPLTEEQTMFIFRQVMSAVQYCHSYGICHRDLKPENILLKGTGQVKIADFGMAALHQGPRVPLWTSCGSPHYAAPELLRAKAYRGEKSDIWSMGVILFAMLAGRLPFDDDDLTIMLAKAKKGIYEMPREFSDVAKDFIHRILQTDPRIRLSMKQMWEHPLVWKYGYLDDLGGNQNLPDPRSMHNIRPLDLCNIDPQILRPLRSMWHTFSEDELVKKLVSNDSNDQKLFYWLLHGYRERQLENYNPTLTHSTSDYHHLRPPMWSTKVSTRQFLTNKGKGHGRSISKFTVISNVAETDAGANLGTVRSYDPYKSPVGKQTQATHARIVIHRDSSAPGQRTMSLGTTNNRKRANSSGSQTRPRKIDIGNRRLTPRSTMSSLVSRQSQGRGRVNSRYKRTVDFSSVRRQGRQGTASNFRKAPSSVAVVETVHERDSSSFSDHAADRASAHPSAKAQASAAKSRDRSSAMLNEELRHFSSSIAKDCDEAFNGSLLSVTQPEDDRSREGSPFSLSLGHDASLTPVTPTATPPVHQQAARPWDSRPLPPTPPSSSHRDAPKPVFTERFAPLAGRPQYPVRGNGYRGGQLTTPSPAERRVVSAPVHGPYGARDMSHLPCIDETSPEKAHDANKARIVSLPPKPAAPMPTPNEAKGLKFLSRAEQTIRVVHSPSSKPFSGAKVDKPLPLKIQKKSSIITGPPARPVSITSVDNGKEADAVGKQGGMTKTSSQGSASTFAMRRKTSSWFKRLSSKDSLIDEAPPGSSTAEKPRKNSASSIASPPREAVTKKRSFLFPFWKKSKTEPRMSLAGPDYEDTPSPENPLMHKPRKSSILDLMEGEDPEATTRKIKPQQNWLARLFRVKPATRVICLSISKRRARQEVAILLRGWRKHGIKDVEVDKERNIVFARLSSKNVLKLKEVSFACEIMTVIEHGKRNHLSIVRFTQEKGAASSFQKIVETMNSVFNSRNLLVADKTKAKMMVKTLNS